MPIKTILLADLIWFFGSLVLYGLSYLGARWWKQRRDRLRGPSPSACMHCPACNKPLDGTPAPLGATGPCVRGNILCADCKCPGGAASTDA